MDFGSHLQVNLRLGLLVATPMIDPNSIVSEAITSLGFRVVVDYFVEGNVTYHQKRVYFKAINGYAVKLSPATSVENEYLHFWMNAERANSDVIFRHAFSVKVSDGKLDLDALRENIEVGVGTRRQ